MIVGKAGKCSAKAKEDPPASAGAVILCQPAPADRDRTAVEFK